MEVEPGIHMLSLGRRPLPGFPSPNSFLVNGSDASLMIDAGWASEPNHQSWRAYMRNKRTPPVNEVIITHHHPDHAGGALRLHEDTGATLSCNPLEEALIVRDHLDGKELINARLEGGEARDLGGLTVQIIAAPGHTHGCLAAYVPERGALFTSDTVMGVSTTVIKPNEGDLAAYEATLHRLLEVGAKTIYPGHGEPVSNPSARLTALIAHRRRREEELLAQLATGAKTVGELRAAIYAGLDESRLPLAEAQIRTGLVKLTREGVVREEGDRYALVV